LSDRGTEHREPGARRNVVERAAQRARNVGGRIEEALS
jgi:hypothetical protein